MDIKKDLLKILPEWCNDVPFQIKGIAIQDAVKAFWATKDKRNLKFKSRKSPEQSCFIPKSAIKSSGIYPRISGNGLRYLEEMPEKPMDSRLIWRGGKWWIAVPYKKRFSRSENQAGRIAAIDPGIRTFAAFYSPDLSGQLGVDDFKRLYRMFLKLDDLVSRRTKTRRKRSLTRAIRRLSQRIQNLRAELHWKTARFFAANFSLILLPTFETKEMVAKVKRKIRSKTVRSMLGFGHYQFKQRLKWMAKKFGVTVIDVDESYTSKTHPITGEIWNVGTRREVKLSTGSIADRDVVGARNILIKFLTERCALPDTATI